MFAVFNDLFYRKSIIIFFYIIVFETFKRSVQKGAYSLHLVFIYPNISALSPAAVSFAAKAAVWVEGERKALFGYEVQPFLALPSMMNLRAFSLMKPSASFWL